MLKCKKNRIKVCANILTNNCWHLLSISEVTSWNGEVLWMFWSMKSSWRKLCFIQLFKFCIFMSANCCYHCLTNVCVIQSISLIECNSLYHTKTRIHKRVKSLACTKCHKTFTSLSVIENIRIHTGPELQKGQLPAQCFTRYSKQGWFENHPVI